MKSITKRTHKMVWLPKGDVIEQVEENLIPHLKRRGIKFE